MITDEEGSEKKERKEEKIEEVQKLALVPRIEVNLLKPLEVAAYEKRKPKSTCTLKEIVNCYWLLWPI